MKVSDLDVAFLTKLAALGRVRTTNPGILYALRKMYDLGLVNIVLPGESYKINAAGLAVLAAIEQAKPKYARRVKVRKAA